MGVGRGKGEAAVCKERATAGARAPPCCRRRHLRLGVRPHRCGLCHSARPATRCLGPLFVSRRAWGCWTGAHSHSAPAWTSFHLCSNPAHPAVWRALLLGGGGCFRSFRAAGNTTRRLPDGGHHGAECAGRRRARGAAVHGGRHGSQREPPGVHGRHTGARRGRDLEHGGCGVHLAVLQRDPLAQARDGMNRPATGPAHKTAGSTRSRGSRPGNNTRCTGGRRTRGGWFKRGGWRRETSGPCRGRPALLLALLPPRRF